MRTNLFKYWTYRAFAPGTILQTTYAAFQDLLACDGRCHEMMADLESLYYQGTKEDFSKISLKYDALAKNVADMVSNLDRMSPGSYVDLAAYFRKFDFYSRYFLAPPDLNFGEPFVLALTDSTITTELAGSKTTTLVELSNDLNLSIPKGFVISTNSFSYLLEYNNLRPAINSLLAEIDLQSSTELSAISRKLKALIEHSEVPSDIEHAILKAQEETLKHCSAGQLFAVRSSALSEDGQCSFAGQYASYLNVTSDQLLNNYLKVLSSKYSEEALAYRIHSGLSDEEAPMAVMVLTMVDPLAAGVIYTTDPSGMKNNTLFIHATKGLGDAVVSGKVIPDVYEVLKNKNQLSNPLPPSKSALTKEQVLTLSIKGQKIENHFGVAQDIEWAMRKDGSFVFLQSRGLQLYRQETETEALAIPKTEKPLICAGVMAATGIAVGKAWCLDSKHPMDEIEQGNILIIDETLPSYVKILHQVNGVVAKLGSSAGHFATVCREFGVPLLLGVGDDVQHITHGQSISLSADDTAVYAGENISLSQKTPAYKRDKNLPFYRKLKSILSFVTPLKLVDPNAKEFTPQSCRSFHDIIRFSHEKAVQAMFSIGDSCSGIKGVKKRLETELPFEVYLVDVDKGLKKDAAALSTITVDTIQSSPFQALWRGLTHPDISWGEQTYYDWKSYDKMALSDAFAFQSNSDSASYAVLGKNYLNMNIRFGYHFTVIDALCEPDATTSYCTMRFAGGGGEFEGRELRIIFLTNVLNRLGFDVKVKGDLLDARCSGISAPILMERIELLGKLLGITKQMDMRLKNVDMVEEQVENFFQEESL